MTDFDVARIVPSTRDFAGAVRTRRSGLALVPVVPGQDVESHVRRLDAHEVRALAIRESGDVSLAAARTTESTPLVLLSPADSTEVCQRARFFGADCVLLSAESYPAHAKTVQSMRMMPGAMVDSAESARAALEAGARLLVVQGDHAVVSSVAAVAERAILVADVPGVDAEGLRRLSGHVDAALVPLAIHASDVFEALLDELDT